MPKSFKRIVEEAAALHTVRSREYGEAYKDHGKIMMEFFPDGITLDSPSDFARFSLFNMIISKMHRYSKSFHSGGHQDSIRDAGVYAHMLEEVDCILECTYCNKSGADLKRCEHKMKCPGENE